MKKLASICVCSFLLFFSPYLRPDSHLDALPLNEFSCSSLVLKTLGFVGIGSIFYTYAKTPQEAVPDHNNAILNFFDNTWCGNWAKEYGTIAEGNRVRPYIIPARGIIGTGMHYFWPAISFAALLGVWYGVSKLIPFLTSLSEGLSDQAAQAIVPSIPVPKGTRIMRMNG